MAVVRLLIVVIAAGVGFAVARAVVAAMIGPDVGEGAIQDPIGAGLVWFAVWTGVTVVLIACGLWTVKRVSDDRA